MSRIFIELYLDEDVDVLVADLIRARGFAALTTREADQLGRDDAAQLVYAANHQKAFVTHNRADFEALAQTYFVTGQVHAGIIIAVRHDPYELARRLLVIINHVTADEMQDQLRYI